jgi:UDP-N-acetylglucosamine 2-epimerase
MKLVSIVGARPQFVKIAPLARAFALHNSRRSGEPIEHIIVHTGQHYDAGMSDIFFAELEIPSADFNLGVGSGRHGHQTGQMLEKIEKVLLETHPDLVAIYGDTNSTVAGALAAVKLHIPVVHIEAGLRSFNRHMPEEINRIVADHVSDLLLAPTPTAMVNLTKEGLVEKAVWTGDIMYDAVLFTRELAKRKSNVLQRLALVPGSYGVVTVHRAENTDDGNRLRKLLTAFNDIAANGLPLIFPIHPRTAKLLCVKFPHWLPHQGLRFVEPVGYLDMLCLVDHARLTLTDSGGLQKEAFFLGCPCITLREETEWRETVEEGGNVLAGVESTMIREAVLTWERRRHMEATKLSAERTTSFGDGYAAERISEVLLSLDKSKKLLY